MSNDSFLWSILSIQFLQVSVVLDRFSCIIILALLDEKWRIQYWKEVSSRKEELFPDLLELMRLEEKDRRLSQWLVTERNL